MRQEEANHGAIPDENHPETMDGAAAQSTSTFVNPFSVGTRSSHAPGGNEAPSGGRDATKYSDPIGVMKRSQLGQLIDPSGKAVSGQVIMIDNIVKQASEIKLSFKQLASDTTEIAKRQVIIVKAMKSNVHDFEAIADDAIEIVHIHDEHIANLYTKILEAYGLIESLPAVVEGDMGIYTKETMPVAPLVRRDDSKIFSQKLYGPTTRNDDAYSEQGRNVNPFAHSPTAPVVSTMPANTGSLIGTVDESTYRAAAKIWQNFAMTFKFEGETPWLDVATNLNNHKIVVGSMTTNMMTVMNTLFAAIASISGGVDIDQAVIEAVLRCISSGMHEDLDEFGPHFADAITDRTSVANFTMDLIKCTWSCPDPQCAARTMFWSPPFPFFSWL